MLPVRRHAQRPHLVDAHPARRALGMVLRQDHATVRLQTVLGEEQLQLLRVLLYLDGSQSALRVEAPGLGDEVGPGEGLSRPESGYSAQKATRTCRRAGWD